MEPPTSEDEVSFAVPHHGVVKSHNAPASPDPKGARGLGHSSIDFGHLTANNPNRSSKQSSRRKTEKILKDLQDEFGEEGKSVGEFGKKSKTSGKNTEKGR